MRKMKHSIVFMLVAVLIFSLTACGAPSTPANTSASQSNSQSPSQSQSQSQSSAGSSEKITLGVMCPITGESALYGEIMSRTVLMLVKQLNSKGGLLGKQIEVKVYDNRDDAVETTNAARKAIQNEGVQVFIGTDSSTTTIALAEVCTEYKIPMITSIASNSKVTQTDDGKVRRYIFRAGLSDPQLGEIIGAYTFKKLQYKKCALIYNIGSDYSIGVAQNFEKNYTAAGGQITSKEAYNNGDVDYRAQLSKIKQAGDFDALYLAVGYYKEDGLIANQARALGITQPFVGTDSLMASDIFNIAGKNVEGTTFMCGVDVYANTLQAFKDDYIKEYGYDPSENAAADAYLAYDAFTMLKTAIEKAGAMDSEKICDAFESLKDLQGLTCKISVNPKTHNPIREAPIYRINNQKFETIDKYSVEK